MKIWIGGSSGLAQTYFNTFPITDEDESWILIGCEPTPPKWILSLNPQRYRYIHCDLSRFIDESAEQPRVMDAICAMVKSSVMSPTSSSSSTKGKDTIDGILVGIRPPLVTYRTNEEALRYNNAVVSGLYLLLQNLLATFSDTLRIVLHISSIAAVNHIAPQHLRSITTPDPSYSELHHPYDHFKRQCEVTIEKLVRTQNKSSIQYTSIRLGAIFSDTSRCIQCTALMLQLSFFGPYLPTHIDCNSSYNVSQLLHEMLLSSSALKLRPIYYYTRCVSQYPYPVPYGEYLLSYKKAYFGTPLLSWFVPILIPSRLIEYGVVKLLHIVTSLIQMLHSYCRNVPIVIPFIPPPYLESIDYLLQVTLNEHTFEMKETIQDFPNIVLFEETMEECFRRRRRNFRNDEWN